MACQNCESVKSIVPSLSSDFYYCAYYIKANVGDIVNLFPPRTHLSRFTFVPVAKQFLNYMSWI